MPVVARIRDEFNGAVMAAVHQLNMAIDKEIWNQFQGGVYLNEMEIRNYTEHPMRQELWVRGKRVVRCEVQFAYEGKES